MIRKLYIVVVFAMLMACGPSPGDPGVFAPTHHEMTGHAVDLYEHTFPDTNTRCIWNSYGGLWCEVLKP